MAALQAPSADEFVKISQVQEQREREYKQRLCEARREHGLDPASNSEQDLAQAATVIQKTYRGYRARRQQDGLGLDASTRWVAAIREAEFRNKIRPKARGGVAPGGDGDGAPAGDAKQQWKKAAVVAKRAGHAPGSDSSSQSDPESGAAGGSGRKPQREEDLVMKMQYFLEMVDLKHRHGSNLRKYHNVWNQADTKENFFYWLDHGEGRDVELEVCSREKLERDQVRYLSREERQYYLVTVDGDGRLCWAKNGARIGTTPTRLGCPVLTRTDTSDEYKDSIHGIVPVDDPTPGFTPTIPNSTASSSTSSLSQPPSSPAPKSPKPSTHPLRNLIPHPGFRSKWIFVCDTSQNLYVGIKSHGAFQHSSFLQGSRIHTAGLLRIRDGRLKSLSPLSGHYRPPAGSFRGFIRLLRGRGVDVSVVTVSKAYVVLSGLEMYVGTRSRGKRLKEGLFGRRDGDEDVEVDGSESARKEREVLEKQRGDEAKDEHERTGGVRLLQKLKIPVRESTEGRN